jgi:ubiquitin carboxyl-terminal hydrolase 5/13
MLISPRCASQLTSNSHYVAFIRKAIEDGSSPSWVLYNDEKVVKAVDDVDEMKKFAYVYFFQRK